MVRSVINLPDACGVTRVQDSNNPAHFETVNDAQLAIVARRNDCRVSERMVNLSHVLHIIPVVHMLKWFDQVAQILTVLYLARLSVDLNKWLLNHVLV